MTTALGQFQQAFAQALFAPQTPESPQSADLKALVMQPAFAVYRNTVMKACIDALEANFPAVLRLVGNDWFRAAAALYVTTEGPRDARLLHYGEGFAGFLRDFPPAAELVYLPGVSQLDTLWRASHTAPDAHAVDAAWLAGHTPEQITELALRPHPAARWAWFEDQPIYTIWDSNRRHTATPDPLRWEGEGALLTRPHDTVIWQQLSRAGCALLDACTRGVPLAEAADRALKAEPQADIASTFAALLQAGALVADGMWPPPSAKVAP